MPKIIFTATPELPRDIAYLAYKAGDVVVLSPDSCRRWIKRGVAKFYAEPSVPAAAEAMAEIALPVADEIEDEAADQSDVADDDVEPVAEQKPRRGRPRR